LAWAGLRLRLRLNVILQAKGGFGFDGREGWIVKDVMVGAIRGRDYGRRIYDYSSDRVEEESQI
jgi:hypothetical protein